MREGSSLARCLGDTKLRGAPPCCGGPSGVGNFSEQHWGVSRERGHGDWTGQAARNLFLRLTDELVGQRAHIRDRGGQFVDTFDEIVHTEGYEILKNPVRSSVANTFDERWIAPIRRELLDPTITWNQRQLEHLVIDYVRHHNSHRPAGRSTSDHDWLPGHRRPSTSATLAS